MPFQSTIFRIATSVIAAASMNDHAHAETLVTSAWILSPGLFLKTDSLLAIHEQRHCKIESRPNRLRMWRLMLKDHGSEPEVRAADT